MQQKITLFFHLLINLRRTFNYVVILPLVVALSLYGRSSSYAQDAVSNIIKGRITDARTGIPLPGVSVKEKNKPGGASTTVDGRFILRVSSSSPVLVFTYIGYAVKELRIENISDAIDIKLQEQTTELNQVVVVGYGTQRKALVTGSVSQVSAKEISTSPTANLSAMLQGRLPGLVTRQTSGQPGVDGASLLVRGYSSLNGNSPLVIVDGFQRDFPSVNPDEIESISVLKDAAAAAVYGVLGTNGVILVTTKKGSNQKPSISYNSSLSLSSNTNFPEFLNAPEYAYWYNKAQEMDGISENARRFTAGEIERISNGDPQGVYGNTDWFNLLFKDSAPIYTNNLSVNGGNERYKFFVSLGSYDQQGIIDRTSYKRYNFRTNMDAKITDNFAASFGVALKDDNQKQPGLSAGIGNDYASIFSQAMMSYPFLPAYNAEGMPIASLNGNGNENPLAARDLSGQQATRSTRFQGNVSLKYDVPFLKGLHLTFSGAFDKGHSMKKSYLLPYLLSVYNNTTRTFTETYARHASGGMASLNQWFSESWKKTIQPSLSYDKKIGNHSLSALLLYEYIRNDTESLSGGKRGYPITDIMDLDFGEEVIDDLVKGGHSMTHRAGYVSRLNYDYAGKYIFEFTSRLDGSDKFASDKRWVFSPGFSGGWRISEESFFKDNISFVDDLKLRASYGKLALDNTSGFNFIPTANLGVNPVVVIGDKLSKPLSLSSVPNPGLKWATTSTYNLGIESSMWKGLLGIEGDVFYRVTNNILQTQSGQMPASLGGYFPQWVNSGTVDSRGFELILSHRNHIGDFNYQIKGNVSWSRSKIIETAEDVNIPDYLRKAGNKVGVKYGFVADGLFQSQDEINNSALFGPTRVGEIKLKDLNGDGRITWDQDWTVIGGSDLPEMMFGLNLGGNYKGFDFNVFLQGAGMSDVALAGLYADKDVYDNTFYTMPFYSDGNSPKYLVEGAWTPENTNAKYPRLSATSIQSGGKFSSWWIKDGSYLRLKSVQVGYTLPTTLAQKVNLSSVRLHVSGSNLFTISGLDFLDPEMPSVNQGYYPQQKLYEFGLSVTF